MIHARLDRRSAVLAWLLAGALALVPAAASAQKDVFVDSFVALHSALAGVYGDEGAVITAEFARMAAALAEWDRAAAAADPLVRELYLGRRG